MSVIICQSSQFGQSTNDMLLLGVCWIRSDLFSETSNKFKAKQAFQLAFQDSLWEIWLKPANLGWNSFPCNWEWVEWSCPCTWNLYHGPFWWHVVGSSSRSLWSAWQVLAKSLASLPGWQRAIEGMELDKATEYHRCRVTFSAGVRVTPIWTRWNMSRSRSSSSPVYSMQLIWIFSNFSLCFSVKVKSFLPFLRRCCMRQPKVLIYHPT